MKASQDRIRDSQFFAIFLPLSEGHLIFFFAIISFLFSGKCVTFKHIFLNRKFPKIGNSFLGFKPLFLGIKPLSKQNFLLPTYPRNISAQKM